MQLQEKGLRDAATTLNPVNLAKLMVQRTETHGGWRFNALTLDKSLNFFKPQSIHLVKPGIRETTSQSFVG